MIYQHLSTSTLQTNPSQLGNVKHQFAFSLKQFHRSQLSAIWVRDTDQAGDLGTVPQLRSDTAHGSGVCNISLQRQIYTSQASPGPDTGLLFRVAIITKLCLFQTSAADQSCHGRVTARADVHQGGDQGPRRGGVIRDQVRCVSESHFVTSLVCARHVSCTADTRTIY